MIISTLIIYKAVWTGQHNALTVSYLRYHAWGRYNEGTKFRLFVLGLIVEKINKIQCLSLILFTFVPTILLHLCIYIVPTIDKIIVPTMFFICAYNVGYHCAYNALLLCLPNTHLPNPNINAFSFA